MQDTKNKSIDNKNRVNIHPDFSDLTKPETIINHVEKLKRDIKKTPQHSEILKQLIEQFEPLDFENLAFPQAKRLKEKLQKLPLESEKAKSIKSQLDKLTLKSSHLLILSIENTLKLAETNNWGLCKNNDFIYLYNGSFWSEINKEVFQKFLGEASEKMGVEKFSARYYLFRERLFKQFLATAYLPTPQSNKETVLINLLNGTFEISPQETKLRPFKRSDFITYQLPFEYNPNAKAPIFEAYLNRVLPDKERQNVLAEYLGFVFIKQGSNVLKEEKALILYGDGANGKSVFFDIVTALFGHENITNYSLQNLTEEKGYYRAKINNKLLNYASEINGKLEPSFLKALISGEPVEACLKYGQPFSMTDYAKLIFNCNELPKDVEHTNAYFRRFLIIPFDVTIPEHEQDKNLKAKIIDKELSGVFNWVLQGLDRLLKQTRFSNCNAAQKAVDRYKLESNSVQMFLNENEYKKGVTNYKYIQNFYHEYKCFCQEDGMIPFKKTNFIKQLRSNGFLVDRVSQNKLAVFVDEPSLDIN